MQAEGVSSAHTQQQSIPCSTENFHTTLSHLPNLNYVVMCRLEVTAEPRQAGRSQQKLPIPRFKGKTLVNQLPGILELAIIQLQIGPGGPARGRRLGGGGRELEGGGEGVGGGRELSKNDSVLSTPIKTL